MNVLVIDRDAEDCMTLNDVMRRQGHQVWCVSSLEEATAVEETGFDLVFCDCGPDGVCCSEVVNTFRGRSKHQSEIVLMARRIAVDDVVKWIQLGVTDYLCKPLSRATIQALADAVEQRRYPRKLIEVTAEPWSPGDLIGTSPAIIEVVKTATRYAATDLPIMIKGESGTGKELIARLIHRESPRATGPFVALNCGALPDTLLESELFGYARGAFTGADVARRGLFEEANEGTLLLDEVTETSQAFQVKLLRVLQEGEIRPLGSQARRRVNVRVLAATNRDVRALVEATRFREDLLYRLQGVAITLPPLRKRRVDIPILALAFLAQFKAAHRRLAITNDAMVAIDRYGWPGNIRQLKNTMQRLAALCDGIIRLEDLPREIVSQPVASSIMDDIIQDGSLPTLEELQADYMLRVLDAVGGNKSRAAQVMGVDRKTVYRKLAGDAHPRVIGAKRSAASRI